jgi:SAM-dependent methyltransferase
MQQATKTAMPCGFSEQWETKYAANEHLSVWPWSDLVTYVTRFAKPNTDYNNVLELGCGAGANIPFFQSRGTIYHGVDGSASIIADLQRRFPQLAGSLACCDFTKQIPFDGDFDVVVDRGSVTHNDTKSIQQCLKLVASSLRQGGLFIGIDWFSKEHSDSSRGVAVDDFTRMLSDGPYADTGNVHFSTKAHIMDLFESAGFKVVCLEHKKNDMLVGSDKAPRTMTACVAAFNVVAESM